MQATYLQKAQVLLFLILAILLSFSGGASALSESYYTIHAPFYSNKVSCADSENTDPTTNTSSGVYFMGDSILAGAEGAIRSKLNNSSVENSDITINGEISRSITGKGQEGTSGINAVNTDRDVIKKSSIAIIILGTNGGNTQDNIKKLIKEFEKANKDIKIYWVNIGVSRADLQNTMEDGNKQLENGSKDNGYKVIDWYQEIKGNDRNMLLSDEVHPNEKGYKILSGIIYKDIKDDLEKRQTPDPATTGSGSNVGGDKSNPAKVWAYLVSEQGLGLTPVQAAGAMGNMQQENSAFEPKRTQGGGTSPEVIVDGKTGYGLIQWTTASRQQGLKDHANKIDKKSGTMDAQLTNIKRELNGSYNNTLKRLKKVDNDPVEAALVWHGAGNFSVPGVTPSPGYEASGDTESFVRDVRGGNAKKWLNKYGDKSSSYTDEEACKDSQDDDGTDGVIGSKDYTDNPNKITKGEQVAEQAKKWAKNDPYCGFHGSKGCERQCLGIVTNLWQSVGKGVVTGHTSDDNAWNAYKYFKKNGWVNKNKNIPVGAIMWSADLSNNGNNVGEGHAYTYVGNGLVASNDIEVKGKYSIVPADQIEKKWGHTFLGWSEWHP